MPARRTRTVPAKPRWMSSRQFEIFLRFSSELRKKVDITNLPQREFNSLALFKFVRRKQSDRFPSKPEFPFHRPRFPATPVRGIRIPGLEHVDVRIKDESFNPTGTHKDRLAWEVVVEYAKMLERKAETGKQVPAFSIISNGNAAVAIGEAMGMFGAPPVNALVDRRTHPRVIEEMKRHNVKVFSADLFRKPLTSDEILTLTRNPSGVDLTNGRMARLIQDNYYDWLSFEIFNEKPDYAVVPYGSGELFDNIVMHYYQELRGVSSDPRLKQKSMREGGMNLIGVTAPLGSVADKLSAPYLPGSTLEETRRQKHNVVSQLVSQGVLGAHSRIESVEDKWFYDAHKVAREKRIIAEPSALAGIAWLLKHKRDVPKRSNVLLVNTGRGVFPED